MTRLRIVCKSEDAERRDGREDRLRYPLITGHLAGFSDCYVTVVDPDGKETPLTGVTAIYIEAKQGSEPVRARIEMVDVELDIEAVGEIGKKEG